MNDLYKELYIQAVNSCAEECAKDGVNQAWLWERKYAELIVKECISVSPSGDANYNMSEHFGLGD